MPPTRMRFRSGHIRLWLSNDNYRTPIDVPVTHHLGTADEYTNKLEKLISDVTSDQVYIRFRRTDDGRLMLSGGRRNAEIHLLNQRYHTLEVDVRNSQPLHALGWEPASTRAGALVTPDQAEHVIISTMTPEAVKAMPLGEDDDNGNNGNNDEEDDGILNTWWFWVIIVIVVLLIIGVIIGAIIWAARSGKDKKLEETE